MFFLWCQNLEKVGIVPHYVVPLPNNVEPPLSDRDVRGGGRPDSRGFRGQAGGVQGRHPDFEHVPVERPPYRQYVDNRFHQGRFENRFRFVPQDDQWGGHHRVPYGDDRWYHDDRPHHGFEHRRVDEDGFFHEEQLRRDEARCSEEFWHREQQWLHDDQWRRDKRLQRDRQDAHDRSGDLRSELEWRRNQEGDRRFDDQVRQERWNRGLAEARQEEEDRLFLQWNESLRREEAAREDAARLLVNQRGSSTRSPFPELPPNLQRSPVRPSSVVISEPGVQSDEAEEDAFTLCPTISVKVLAKAEAARLAAKKKKQNANHFAHVDGFSRGGRRGGRGGGGFRGFGTKRGGYQNQKRGKFNNNRRYVSPPVKSVIPFVFPPPLSLLKWARACANLVRAGIR